MRCSVLSARLAPAVVALALTGSVLAGGAAGPAIVGVGAPAGSPFFFPFRMSGDGRALAGAGAVNGSDRAFRWSAGEGFTDLGVLPGGAMSSALGLSADGSVVVGPSGTSGFGTRPYRWTAAGMQNLGQPAGSTGSGAAFGVSADGGVIVGSSSVGAWRWTQVGGFQVFHATAQPRDISADGSTIAGKVGNVAFRWTQAGGMQMLPGLGGALTSAYAISADGAAVVGQSGNVAFRWTAAGGTEALGVLRPGEGSLAQGVSGDGRVVVGSSGSSGFVWTQGAGMVDVGDYLRSFGVDLAGWQVRAVFDVSDDARSFVGYGIDPTGQVGTWVATIPGPGPARLVAIAGILAFRRRR